MAKKIRFITPVVTLVWPKLNEPDVYTPKKGKPKVRYVTNMELEPEDLKKVKAYLEKQAKDLIPDVKNPKLPFKTDEKNDKIYLVASSGEKYRPPVFDAKNKALPADLVIGGGTKAKLDLTVNAFEISDSNSGINLYINGVQVLDLKEGGFGSRFEETEGYSFDGGSKSNNTTEEDDTDEGDEDEAYKF